MTPSHPLEHTRHPPFGSGDINPLAQANTYAALTELHHYNRADTVFNAIYDERSGQLRETAPPFSRVYLSGTLSGGGPALLPPAWKARAALVYPFELPDLLADRLAPLQALLKRRGIGPAEERIQAQAYFAAAVLSEGMAPEVLTQVHAPIGLEIGAVSPQEIAVSILAELIAVKHGRIKSRDAAELSMKWSKIKT